MNEIAVRDAAWAMDRFTEALGSGVIGSSLSRDVRFDEPMDVTAGDLYYSVLDELGMNLPELGEERLSGLAESIVLRTYRDRHQGEDPRVSSAEE